MTVHKPKIRHDLDIPEPYKCGGANKKYLFSEMEIGDHFTTTEPSFKVRAAADSWCKYHGMPWKFRIRTDETGETATCWRVE